MPVGTNNASRKEVVLKFRYRGQILQNMAHYAEEFGRLPEGNGKAFKMLFRG